MKSRGKDVIKAQLKTEADVNKHIESIRLAMLVAVEKGAWIDVEHESNHVRLDFQNQPWDRIKPYVTKNGE